ncbi:hypothetical protein [Thiofilum flexile]|uniref:ParE family toxin-like protein n=1 Tax=Thiofilum flexile TaxID=125627 RepID=UPI0003619A91|nr:hypothetical protein [Thiofilum flexile]
MKHKATPRFWQCFQELPAPIQALARRNYRQLRENPLHPSLHFKEVGNFWSVRVGLHYRALAVARPHGYTWVWIGHHATYDQLIK